MMPDSRSAELRLRSLVERHRHDRGPLLPILHAVQHEFGHVDDGAVDLIAGELNLSRAEVHGVRSFYTDFRTDAAAAGPQVRVCRAEACQSVGAEDVFAAARDAVDGGRGSVEQIFCFGNCALGPTVEIDGVLHGRVEPGDLDGLLDGARAGEPS